MKHEPVIILGGGLSGLAAGLTLLENGEDVIIIEKNDSLGGAARSMPIPENRIVPIGYHHIVGSDKELLRFLRKLNLINRVRWKHIKVSTLFNQKEIDLSWPFDILTFEHLSFPSRLRYLLFGAYCVVTGDWHQWEGRSVTTMVKNLAGGEILKKIFNPLVDIKFGISTDSADAAWLGRRLHHREGATRFGYIPNACWTQELCVAFEKKIIKFGGRIKYSTSVKSMKIGLHGKVTTITTNKGEIIPVKAVISTVPLPVLSSILDEGNAPSKWITKLSKIKYISSYSLIAGFPKLPLRNYWNILLQPRKIFGAIFNLSALNNTLATHKDGVVVNIFTNITGDKLPWTTKQYEEKALADFRSIFGAKTKPNWYKTNFIPLFSPIFRIGYKNPPEILGPNLFLAGIYLTYPKFSSTGEAMASGEKTALKLLRAPSP